MQDAAAVCTESQDEKVCEEAWIKVDALIKAAFESY